MIRVKMEEEEETTESPKKTRRKRKPRRDLSPGLPSPDSAEEEIEEPKKKRGRKKKKKDPEPEDETNDLQKVMRVVEHLISLAVSEAFLHRPDDSVYGMSDYYEVISKPMWLKEVERKFKAEEYSTPTEIAADIRLMLENCYHYWGPNDNLSKRALKLEQMFENKLSSLPEDLQELCSLEVTHKDVMKEEQEDSPNKKSNKKGVYNSKLLKLVINGQGHNGGDSEKSSSQKTVSKARQTEQAEAEKQLSVWEAENFLNPSVEDQIASMWEFPVIGQFLHMVYDVLNIDPIPPLELERMLLIPQASNSLAMLMTSMLIPPLFRAKLESGPAMPYSIWTQRLNTKVASWYRSYHSKGDSTVEVHKRQSKVFDSLGIEPQFWLVMGEDNPLADFAFHELTFLQRVWLLKGLCDFIMHNHKTIQDCINNLEMEDLREQKLGRDKEGYSYHYFPMFTEVRIYKMAKVPDAKWKPYEKGVEEAITMYAEEEDDEEPSKDQNLIGFSRRPLHKPPRSMRPSHSDFKLVCQSLKDIRQLVDKFRDSDPPLHQGQGVNAQLVAKLQSIVSQLECRESKMELAVFKTRCRMKGEWLMFCERRPDFIDPGIAYWERKAKEEEKTSSFDKESELSTPGSSTDIMLPEDEKRERRARRESSFKLMAKDENGGMVDESDDESPLDFGDNSEDEWFASKKDKENDKKTKIKKRRGIPAKKIKKQASKVDKNQYITPTKDKEIDNLYSKCNSGAVKLSVSPETPVKIKEEPCEVDEFERLVSQTNKSLQKAHGSLKASKQHSGENSKKKDGNKNKTTETIVCKQEVLEETQPQVTNPTHSTVIQSLVRPVSNVKLEKAVKSPLVPDLSNIKRSNSPESEVVYISDSEDSPDVKPNPTLLAKQLSRNSLETINYSMAVPQQPVSGYLVPNQTQFLPVNVAPGDQINAQPQVFSGQPQVFNVAQQPLTYPVAAAQPPIVQQPVIRPNPAVVRLQSPPRANLSPNQKFLLIQPTASNVNQPGQFVSKGPRGQVGSFPTTPTMQSVNWFGSRGSPQANYSPRQRGGVNQSPRGRGSPQSPMTPTRGVHRFGGRTTPNTIRTPGAMARTPTQVGARTPSPMRGRPIGTVRPGPVRNLNFNPSPIKAVSRPVNDLPDTPDIEGTLVVSLTDSGGFGYVVMLADGGKISLTNDQLAKIRSDNGGTLPKTCKVPLNMQTEGFRID